MKEREKKENQRKQEQEGTRNDRKEEISEPFSRSSKLGVDLIQVSAAVFNIRKNIAAMLLFTVQPFRRQNNSTSTMVLKEGFNDNVLPTRKENIFEQWDQDWLCE